MQAGLGAGDTHQGKKLQSRALSEESTPKETTSPSRSLSAGDTHQGKKLSCKPKSWCRRYTSRKETPESTPRTKQPPKQKSWCRRNLKEFGKKLVPESRGLCAGSTPRNQHPKQKSWCRRNLKEFGKKPPKVEVFVQGQPQGINIPSRSLGAGETSRNSRKKLVPKVEV